MLTACTYVFGVVVSNAGVLRVKLDGCTAGVLLGALLVAVGKVFIVPSGSADRISTDTSSRGALTL